MLRRNTWKHPDTRPPRPQVRVSHAKYVPFATWLITQRPDLFLKDVEIYTPVADFVRAVKGTVPQGKRPPMDLYIVGPGDGDQAGGNSTYTPTFLVRLLAGLLLTVCALECTPPNSGPVQASSRH